MRIINTLFAWAALLLCSTSLFAHDFEVEGIYYNIASSEEKTVGVTYKGNDYESYTDEYSGLVVIPETVTYKGNVYRVIRIEGDAFYECSSLTSVVIPNTVTYIDHYAFGCSGLTSVVIPNSVESMGADVFGDCPNLTSVVIGNSVTSIGDYTFKGCSALTSVVIPNNVTSIGRSAFKDCDGLTSVVIGNSVTSIGDGAFYDCDGLTSVEIPNNVTSIGDYAFFWCSGLTSVVIGNGVESIGSFAFSDCMNLTKIICNAITPPTCGTQVFDYIDKNTTTLMVPNGAMSAYQSAAQWSDFFNIEHIPTSIEGVKADARGDGTSPVYNLQGVRVQGTDNLPAGIYIRGGKKFMVK